jgi:protein-tyrosine phosphatase
MEPLGRPRRRWEDNIKMDLREIDMWDVLDRYGSEQGQVAVCCKCGNEHSGSIKYGEFLH